MMGSLLGVVGITSGCAVDDDDCKNGRCASTGSGPDCGSCGLGMGDMGRVFIKQ
jgi:hypothetical protein